MARNYTKNASNFTDFGTNLLTPKLTGSPQISAGVWVNPRTFDFSTTVACNWVFHIKIDSSATAISLHVENPGVASGPAKAVVEARSVSTDTKSTFTSLGTLVTADEYGWSHLGAVVDYVAKTCTIYINGAVDSILTTANFGNNSLTGGVPSNQDTIGVDIQPPSATANQWNGKIGDLAFWNCNIGSEGFSTLWSGFQPTCVSPANLKFWMRLDGATAERDLISGLAINVTGSVPAQQHPPVLSGGRSSLESVLRRMHVATLTAAGGW